MSRLDRVTDWSKYVRRADYCVATLARKLNVTPRQLERHFQTTQQMTPKVWIDNIRMKDAKRMLRRGASIKEVAIRIGFRYPEHFARAFERVHGMAPSQAFPKNVVLLPANVAKRQEMSHFGR